MSQQKCDIAASGIIAPPVSANISIADRHSVKRGTVITDTIMPASENVPKYIAESGIPASAAHNDTHNVSQSLPFKNGSLSFSHTEAETPTAPAPTVVTAESIRPASRQARGSKSVISSTASPTELRQSLLR